MPEDLSPLAALVAEIREERLRRRALAGGPAPAVATSGSRRPEPELSLETRVVSDPPLPGHALTAGLLPASFALHGVLLIALVVGPALMPEALPPPTFGTKLFYVSPLTVPPPAAPGAAPTAVLRTPLSRPVARPFVVPVEAQADVVLDDQVALDLAAGEPGGVEGGVPGGVVGGIVGGLQSEPLASLEPVRVGGEIKEPVKLKHVNPVYPAVARRANVQGSIIVECIVSPQGRVTDARVLRGIPLLDAAALAAVRQWLYTPTLRDGVPVPVVLTVTVQFVLR